MLLAGRPGVASALSGALPMTRVKGHGEGHAATGWIVDG